MKEIIASYVKGLGWVAITVVAAALIAWGVNAAKLPFLSDIIIHWARIITAALFAAATLGRCGWGVQTWGGKTAGEDLNLKIFRGIYLVGFGLLVLAFLLTPAK